MQLAVGILALIFSLIALTQSCALTSLSSLAADQKTGEAGALGLMAALLILVGGAFAFRLPRVAQALFLLAFVASIPAREHFPDMLIWGFVAVILAGLLLFRNKIDKMPKKAVTDIEK